MFTLLLATALCGVVGSAQSSDGLCTARHRGRPNGFATSYYYSTGTTVTSSLDSSATVVADSDATSTTTTIEEAAASLTVNPGTVEVVDVTTVITTVYYTDIVPPADTYESYAATSVASSSSSSSDSAPSTPTSTLASVSSSPLSASIVATATLSAASATSTDYETVVLYQHNIHRANHSASDFVWNSTLASIAQEIGETCIYEHNTEVGGGGYGQNIGAGWSAAEVGAMITDAMYNDEMMNFQDLYGEANPNMTNFEHWGHFSQIVWKNSASWRISAVIPALLCVISILRVIMRASTATTWASHSATLWSLSRFEHLPVPCLMAPAL